MSQRPRVQKGKAYAVLETNDACLAQDTQALIDGFAILTKADRKAVMRACLQRVRQRERLSRKVNRLLAQDFERRFGKPAPWVPA